jgi:hypothetical protein
MYKFRLLTLAAVILLLTLPVSGSDIGFHRVAPKAGLIFPQDLDMGFMFGGAADLGELTDNLSLVPLVSYWTAGTDEGGLDISFSNIQIGGDVHFNIENVEGLYVGGGLSINFESGSTEFKDFLGNTYTGDWSDTDIGFGFLGGYEMPVGDNTAFAQGKFNIISNFNTFEINLGMWFDMN